jgi:hypothetical protein
VLDSSEAGKISRIAIHVTNRHENSGRLENCKIRLWLHFARGALKRRLDAFNKTRQNKKYSQLQRFLLPNEPANLKTPERLTNINLGKLAAEIDAKQIKTARQLISSASGEVLLNNRSTPIQQDTLYPVCSRGHPLQPTRQPDPRHLCRQPGSRGSHRGTRLSRPPSRYFLSRMQSYLEVA